MCPPTTVCAAEKWQCNKERQRERKIANKPIKLSAEGMVMYIENYEKSKNFLKRNKILEVNVFNKKMASIQRNQLYFHMLTSDWQIKMKIYTPHFKYTEIHFLIKRYKILLQNKAQNITKRNKWWNV